MNGGNAAGPRQETAAQFRVSPGTSYRLGNGTRRALQRSRRSALWSAPTLPSPATPTSFGRSSSRWPGRASATNALLRRLAGTGWKLSKDAACRIRKKDRDVDPSRRTPPDVSLGPCSATLGFGQGFFRRNEATLLRARGWAVVRPRRRMQSRTRASLPSRFVNQRLEVEARRTCMPASNQNTPQLASRREDLGEVSAQRSREVLHSAAPSGPSNRAVNGTSRRAFL